MSTFTPDAGMTAMLRQHRPAARPGTGGSPIRVLLLCQSLDLVGGVERFACALAGHLAQQGFDAALGSVDTQRHALAYDLDPGVRLLTGRSPRAESRPPVDNLVSAMRAWALLREQWRTGRALAGLIRAERPDVVVLNGLTTACSVLLLNPGFAGRVICCDHNHFDARSRPWRWLRRRLYPKVAALVSLTEADAPRFRALNPRTEVIANASSLWLEAPPGSAPSHDLPPLVLAIGRCVEQKGFDLLLQAWQQLRERPSLPACRLRIVGEGPLREALMAQSRRLGVDASVEWVPPTRDIERHYREAALFVLPSRYEGLPLALLEAQAMGLPAVALDCPTGPAEVIVSDPWTAGASFGNPGPGASGIVVPAEDVKALAEALAVLLAQPSLRERMGRAAWQRSRDHFSLSRHRERWTTLIRAVAGQGAAQARHA